MILYFEVTFINGQTKIVSENELKKMTYKNVERIIPWKEQFDHLLKPGVTAEKLYKASKKGSF